MGLRTSAYESCSCRIFIVGFGGIHLRLRAGNLLALAHLLQRLQMPLRGFELALRLHHGDLRVVRQLLRERALLHEFHAVVIQLLRGIVAPAARNATSACALVRSSSTVAPVVV